jgi:PiT family inorganic phosphate transporter
LTSDAHSLLLITSGVLGAIVWNYSSLLLKLPTSSSFTLVGGLMGPVLYVFGWKAVPWGIFFVKVVLAMFLSPLLGLTVGYMVYSMTIFCLERASLKANEAIKKLQILTLIVLGVNHGTNDSQKSMGIIVLLLFIAGRNPDMTVPLWVKVICISAITLGVLMAGQTIIKTVGYGIFKIRPHHSLEAQLSAAGILLACNVLGAPVSTTQIVSSSVVGVGSAFRMKTVRWGIIKDIFNSWLITIPVSAATAIAIYVVLKRIIA